MTPTLPIAKQPDVSQIERLRSIVADRHCVVIGSAPLRTKYVDVDPSEVTIPVNGGISSLQGPVDVWVVNSKAQDALGAMIRPLHKLMIEQGRGRAVGHLMLLRGPKVASEQLTLAALKSMKCVYSTWSVLDKATKRYLEGARCDRLDDKKPCSSGVLTAAMALYAGAASVRLAGFSLKPGYHYTKEQPQRWWRDHVEADKRAIQALSCRFGGKLSGDLVAEAVAA